MPRQPRRTSLSGEERSFNSACGCERNTGRHAFRYFQLVWAVLRAEQLGLTI
jgi:hypothetical protein